MLSLPDGIRHLPAYFDGAEQQALVEDIRAVVAAAPLYTPAMPRSGKEMSVRMTNCGALGWVTDKERGYRYQPTHPVTGKPWPAIPERLLSVWRQVAGDPQEPQACLVNFYDAAAKMGLHQDRDEEDFSAPVVSISLGDACLFRVGGTKRNMPTTSFRLESVGRCRWRTKGHARPALHRPGGGPRPPEPLLRSASAGRLHRAGPSPSASELPAHCLPEAGR